MSDLVIQEKTSFFAQNERQMASSAMSMASVLKDIVVKQKLSVRIGPSEHIKAEGWATLGAFLGVLPRESKVTESENGDFIAYVDLVKQSDGTIVGGASALCGIDEKRWANADRYARRSMAITRATGKAYRLSFAWIVTMAGYSPTPCEEMPDYEPPESKKVVPGYDPQNRVMQDWLVKQLKKKKIDEDRWDTIGNALAGRPSTDLDSVINQLGC